MEINRYECIPHPCYSKALRDDYEFDKLVTWTLGSGVPKSDLFVSRNEDGQVFVVGGLMAAEAYFVGFPHGTIKTVEVLSTEEAISMIYTSCREELSLCPVEEGHLIKDIKAFFTLSDISIGKCIGRSRQSVNHAIKILSLPKDVKGLISAGCISMQSAKYLAYAPRHLQGTFALKAFKNNWSSRKLYKEINKDFIPKAEQSLMPRSFNKPADLLRFEENITALLGLVTAFTPLNEKITKGDLSIKFSSFGEFTRLLELITSSQDSKAKLNGHIEFSGINLEELDVILENILSKVDL